MLQWCCLCCQGYSSVVCICHGYNNVVCVARVTTVLYDASVTSVVCYQSYNCVGDVASVMTVSLALPGLHQ